ncbi:MAG: hypothetical protein ACREAA_06785 [Candidatus Polarisedimenticolia bacterium]
MSCHRLFVTLLVSAAALTGAASDTPPGKPPAPPSAGPITSDEASKLTRDLIPRVEELRGLAFKRAVPVKVVNDAEAQRHFKSRLDKFYPEKVLKAEQRVYEDLGLLPQGYDLVAGIFSLLEEQAGGYYDPDTDTFQVLDDMPRAAGAVLVVHELTHALDDQHFSIDQLFERTADDADRSTMAGAVVEGSGTVIMTAFMLQEMQSGRMNGEAMRELMESEAGRAEKLMGAPAVLQRSLLAPYVLGQTLALKGDSSAILKGPQAQDLDRLFKDLPVSTEQLLHPAKYWDAGKRDLPRPLQAPDASSKLGQGWSLQAEGTLGELTLALLCGATNPSLDSVSSTDPSVWTNACAEGWGADRWQLYRKGDAFVTVLATVWDTEADAGEFEAHLKTAGRKPARAGSLVTLVAGAPAEAAEPLAGEILRGLSAPAPTR